MGLERFRESSSDDHRCSLAINSVSSCSSSRAERVLFPAGAPLRTGSRPPIGCARRSA